MRKNVVSQVSLAVLLAGIGVLVVAQLRAQRHLRALTYDRDEQAVLLSELVEANGRLRDEIGTLTARQAAYQEADRGAIMEELVAELNRVRVLNGAVEVSGPGIELLIDGPLNALDMQDLVNELRNAGAEAIALNGLRLVMRSVFTVGDRGVLSVEGSQVWRPYQLEAIGDPSAMETALLRPGGLTSALRRSYPNLAVQIVQHPRLVLDVYHPRPTLHYAVPVD